MKSWQVRQKHHNDYENTLRSTCVIIETEKGPFIQKYNGSKFWEMFKLLGHTNSDIEMCSCKNNVEDPQFWRGYPIVSNCTF